MILVVINAKEKGKPHRLWQDCKHWAIDLVKEKLGCQFLTCHFSIPMALIKGCHNLLNIVSVKASSTAQSDSVGNIGQHFQ